jgi:hypothetical protein
LKFFDFAEVGRRAREDLAIPDSKFNQASGNVIHPVPETGWK